MMRNRQSRLAVLIASVFLGTAVCSLPVDFGGTSGMLQAALVYAETDTQPSEEETEPDSTDETASETGTTAVTGSTEETETTVTTEELPVTGPWSERGDISWYNPVLKNFTLTTGAQLAGLAKLVNIGYDDFAGKKIQLGANISLDLGSVPSDPALWTPIGRMYHSEQFCFRGTFDGNGYQISGMLCEEAGEYGGFFGCLDGAEIINLKFANVLCAADMYAGAIAGWANETVFSNCQVSGSVSAYFAGGLCGKQIGGSVTLCSSACNVDGSYAGGLLGTSEAAVIQTSRNSGRIHAAITAGGICSLVSEGSLEKLYNTGSCCGTMLAGGIVGDVTAAPITSCYNLGSVSSDSAYAYLGGIAGAASNLHMESCYDAGSVSVTDRAGAMCGVTEDTGGATCAYLEGDLEECGLCYVSGFGDMQVLTLEEMMTPEFAAFLGDDYFHVEGSTPFLTWIMDLPNDPIELNEIGTVQQLRPLTDITENLIWTSSAPEIVSVSDTGELTALAYGTAVITLEAGERTFTWKVSVYAAPVLDQTELSFYYIGQSQQLTLTPSDGRLIGWSSSNRNVAVVSSTGMVTAVGAGSTYIVASVGGQELLCRVDITAEPQLNMTECHIAELESTLQLLLYNVETDSIRWISSNPVVASVDDSGLVTAHCAGVAKIYCVAEGVSYLCAIQVGEIVYSRGDVDANGMVDSDDAVLALREYTAAMLGDSFLTEAEQLSAADVDENGSVDSDDAMYILRYYTMSLLGEPDWDSVLQKTDPEESSDTETEDTDESSSSDTEVSETESTEGTEELGATEELDATEEPSSDASN